jgi:hypothetical protein
VREREYSSRKRCINGIEHRCFKHTTSKSLSHNDEITATPLANETAANTASYTVLQATTAITTTATTADTAATNTNDANSTTCVDTATAASSTNDVDSEPLPFTYTHDKVAQLLEDATVAKKDMVNLCP